MARTRRAKSKGKKLRYSRKRKYTKRKYSKKSTTKRRSYKKRYTKKRPMMRRRKSYGPSIAEMSWVVNNFGGSATRMETPLSMPRKIPRQDFGGGSAMTEFPDFGEFKMGSGVEL